jgi:hypothetical protein
MIYLSAGNKLIIGNEFDVVALGQGHDGFLPGSTFANETPHALLLGLGIQGIDLDNLDFKG